MKWNLLFIFMQKHCGREKLSLKPVSVWNSWSSRMYMQVLISSQAFEKVILNLSQIHGFNYARLTSLINLLYSPLLKVFNSRILIEPGPKWKWCHLHHHSHSSSTAIKLTVHSANKTAETLFVGNQLSFCLTFGG